MASAELYTVGRQQPSRCQVAPLSSERSTPARLATMIGCGVTVSSMTTDSVGRSGRLVCGLPLSVPLTSVQFAPPLVVRNTCLVRLDWGRFVKPPKVTTAVSRLVGSTAIEVGKTRFDTVGAPWMGNGVQAAPAPALALVVRWVVPSFRLTQMVFASLGARLRPVMGDGNVCI